MALVIPTNEVDTALKNRRHDIVTVINEVVFEDGDHQPFMCMLGTYVSSEGSISMDFFAISGVRKLRIWGGSSKTMIALAFSGAFSSSLTQLIASLNVEKSLSLRPQYFVAHQSAFARCSRSTRSLLSVARRDEAAT